MRMRLVITACLLTACTTAPVPDDVDDERPASSKKKDSGASPDPVPSGSSSNTPPAPSCSSSTPVEEPVTDGGPGPSGTGTCPGVPYVTGGAIDAKYKALGGCSGILGTPVSNEMGTGDNVGRYNLFQQGVIMFTPKTDAREVHGRIYERWKSLNKQGGVLGYPITDEAKTPDGVGRYSVFETGSVYWSPKTDAYEVLGRIRDKYKELGWEAGALGYPTSGEVAVTGGRKSDFENGSIVWKAADDTFTVTMKQQ